MKKILALVLSVMMLGSIAFAEEATIEVEVPATEETVVSGSITEEEEVYTDSEIVVVAPMTEAVEAFIETIVAGETSLVDMLSDETIAAVAEMLGENVIVNDIFELEIEALNKATEDEVVTFHLETVFEKDQKVAMVFVSLNDNGAEVLNDSVIEGIGNEDGTVTAVVPVELMKTIVENAAHVAVITMTAAAAE